MKYKRKPEIVEAVQWNKPGDHPDVVKDHSEFYIPTGAYPVGIPICTGDYILTHSDGSISVMSEKEFTEKYEKVEKI